MPIKYHKVALPTSGTGKSKFGFSTAQTSSSIHIAIYVNESPTPNTNDNHTVLIYWNDSSPPLADEIVGIPLARADAPSQIYKIVEDNIEKAKTVDPDVVAQFPDNVKVWLGIDAPSGSSSSGGNKGGSSTASPADDASALQQFLAEHLGLYFDKVVGNYKKDELDNIILSPGGFGPASRAALAGFVAKIKDRIPSSAVKAFKQNGPITDSDADKLTKDSTPAALQFAWVATHPAGQSGFAAAVEIGFDTTITAGIFATAGTPLRKLYDMLALSPAPFVVVTTPIPASAQIITSDGTNKNTVSFPSAFPDGAILGIGIEPADSAQVYSTGGALNTDVHGPVAQAVLANSNSVTMQLKLADGTTYAVTGSIKIGESVTFGNPAAGAAASPAAAITDPVANAKSLSGESRLQMNTSLGLTVGGTRPGFTLENVYMTTRGVAAMNSPQVVLQKRTGGSGDVFELSVNTAEDAVILIPIVEKQSLKEAVEHWSETIFATLTPAAAKSGTPHVALKQITWGYEEHYRRFGLPDVGNIRLIAYEPSTSSSIPEDVNVISIEAAIRDGYTGNSKWDPIEYAIAMYIANDKNVVGTRLYTSAALNREMNSFPGTRYQTN